MRQVTVLGLPDWMPTRLLGPGDWRRDDQGWTAALTTDQAALLQSRLRGHGYGGSPVQVRVRPGLKRPQVRAGRTADARLRRDTTPGFTRPGTRLDDEGRWSLTPESLALWMGRQRPPGRFLDAGCGVGGNAIGLARAGHRVIAIEQDASRLAMARHNAGIYEVADRITFVHGDVHEALGAHEVDVTFFDPPWGVDWDRERCGLTEPLASWLAAVRSPEVWLKLPPSFDPSECPWAEPVPVFGKAAGDRERVKFLWLRGAPAQRDQQAEQQHPGEPGVGAL